MFSPPRLAGKHQKKTIIMQIQGHHHVSPQVVEQSQTQASGRLGTVEARQVATPREAIQLAHRQEAPKAEGLLSRLGAAIARPFVALKEWLGKLLGSHSEVPAAPSADEFHRQQAELKSRLMAMALAPGLSGLDKTGELVDLTPETLASEHTRLATGNGALRSLVTALSGIRDGSQVEATRRQAALLLEKNLGGIPLQQWGTTGRQASEWVSRADQEQFGQVTDQLKNLMHQVAQLRYAVESEVKGEPADKTLAEGLQNQFGLEAEQYLGEQPHGTYSDAEVMALGLYTNGEYESLNRALRQEKPLNAGHTMIDQGMSAAFEKSVHSEQVVKTFRGTRGGDSFSGVAEGKVGHDAAYLSTSRDPQVAKNFGGTGSISTVFGRSGIDVSDISIEGDEQEILYNKETEMRVLLSAKDERGVTRRVLEEATLGVQSGHHKGLLDALDLARETESTGKPAEQDIRLKMRGLDLA